MAGHDIPFLGRGVFAHSPQNERILQAVFAQVESQAIADMIVYRVCL